MSRAQCDWFYRRSGTLVRSPFMLDSGWFDPALTEYLAPNLVAEAAKDFGVTDDRVRLAIATRRLREGQTRRRLGSFRARRCGGGARIDSTPPNCSTARVRPKSKPRVRATTREFHALGVTQRPTFVLENAWGDRAVLSGLGIGGSVDCRRRCAARRRTRAARLRAHHGGPPPTDGSLRGPALDLDRSAAYPATCPPTSSALISAAAAAIRSPASIATAIAGRVPATPACTPFAR